MLAITICYVILCYGIAKAHSKDKKTRYYYYCKNTVNATGHKCMFRVNIEQTEMNRMVAAIIYGIPYNGFVMTLLLAKGMGYSAYNILKKINLKFTQVG